MGLLDNNRGPNTSTKAITTLDVSLATQNSGATSQLFANLPPASAVPAGTTGYASDAGPVYSDGANWYGSKGIDGILSAAQTVQTITATNQALTANVPFTLGTITGTGQIERIFLTKPSLLYNNNIVLLIYVDGATLPLILPICEIVGGSQAGNNNGAISGIMSTRYFELQLDGEIVGTHGTLLFRVPIPFSSSVTIKALAPFGGDNVYLIAEAHMGIPSVRRLRSIIRPYQDFPAWSSGTSYLQGSLVLRSGNNYIALADNTNTDPATNASTWSVVSIQNPGQTITAAQVGSAGVVIAQVTNKPVWLVSFGLDYLSTDGGMLENGYFLYDVASGTPALGTAGFKSTGGEDFFGSGWYFRPFSGVSGTTDANGQNRYTVAPGASPYTYQNKEMGPQYIAITGGTVSAIAISRDNVTYDTMPGTSGQFYLAVGDYIQVTYSVAPTFAVYPALTSGGGTGSSQELIVTYVWPPSQFGSSPKKVGVLRDFLGPYGGIKFSNGMLIRLEDAVGKGNFGGNTKLAWGVLYYE